MTARQKDLTLGALVAVIFGLVYFCIIPVQVPIQSPVKFVALSPDFWPKNITLLIVLLGLFQIVYALFHKYPDEHAGDRTKTDDIKDFLLGCILLAYCFAAPALGMLLSSCLAMLGCMLLFGERKILPLAIYSIAVPLCMHLFLVKVAKILIPQGVLPI